MIDSKEDRNKNFNTKVIMLIFLCILKSTDISINCSQLLKPKINILIWTKFNSPPLIHMVPEKLKQCAFNNCFVTKQKIFNEGFKKFDVILFDLMEIRYDYFVLPKHRSDKQRYVFVTRDPSALYNVSSDYDGIFNLTWTYKLNSDIVYKYFVIKNKKGEVIGPKRDMKWMDINDMRPISRKTERKLQHKRKIAAWFVSHCHAPSGRTYFAILLQGELAKYELKVDIFGICGNQHECRNRNESKCYKLLKSDYYFYMAFENSMCEDYVTEKVITATQHFAVPIVLGGADYTRFLPPGSYLEAHTLGPEKLAYIMNDTMYNKTKYFDFFKWRRYYSLHHPSGNLETDEICQFCAFFNDRINNNLYTSNVYDDINGFWSK